MQIIRTPQRGDIPVEFSVDGDVITVNGEQFDFSAVPEGGYVEDVPCVWIVGKVKREAGEIILTLIQPYKPEEVDVES